MRYLTYTILIILNFLLQTTLLEKISILGIKPNTMVILIISFAFMRGNIEGALIGFFSGLLVDSFFGSFLGLNAFIGMLTGFLCGKIFNEFYNNNPFIVAFLTAIFTFINDVIFFLLRVLLLGKPNIIPFLKSIIIPEVLYTSLVSIIIYKILYYINLKLDKFDRKKRNYFKQ